MKKILLSLFICGLTLHAISQNASVEKSTFGIQTGFLGVWIHNESKLSDLISLRTEIGLDTGGIKSKSCGILILSIYCCKSIKEKFYVSNLSELFFGTKQNH